MGLVSFFDRHLLFNHSYVSAARSLISILNAVDTHPQLYLNKDVLTRSIARYEHVWIPLLSKVPPSTRVSLVPPLDVEWVWICHMLAPQFYVVDSSAMWNAVVPDTHDYVIDHVLLDTVAYHEAIDRTRDLWTSHFLDEPFSILAEIDAQPLFTSPSSPGHTASASTEATHTQHPTPSRISYNIAAAAERQMAFHYQVAITPQYRHFGFLLTAAARYRKFLKLFTSDSSLRFVPSHDIDLMWRVHLLHPRVYASQTMSVASRLIPHEDPLNDHSADSKLLHLSERTCERWRARYNTSLSRPGAMFRGTITRAERILRPEIEAGVQNLTRMLPEHEGQEYCMNVKFLHEDTTMWSTGPSETVEWVHSTEASAAMRQIGEGIWRVSALSVEGSEWNAEARLMASIDLRSGLVHSAVEIVDPRAGDTGLPLASAHVAAAGSEVLNKPTRKFKPLENQEHGTTLVLRVGGRDVALLAGQWRGFIKPVPSRPGIKRVHARPGAFQVAVAFLGQRPRWTALVSRYWDSAQLPPTVEIVDEDEDMLKGKVCVNLCTGSVSFSRKVDAMAAGILGLGVGMLHAQLQPRVQDAADRMSESKNTSMYPQWTVEQKKHSLLTAGGGEWENGSSLTGYGALLMSAEKKSDGRMNQEVWSKTMGNRERISFGKKAKTFNNGLVLGYVAGWSFDNGGNYMHEAPEHGDACKGEEAVADNPSGK